jgi:hypothetical protein
LEGTGFASQNYYDFANFNDFGSGLVMLFAMLPMSTSLLTTDPCKASLRSYMS